MENGQKSRFLERIVSILNNKFRPPESFQKNTEKTIVLVDYSNLLYRAWFVSNKRPWMAYCKFFDMLRLCVKRSKQKNIPLEIIFVGESKTQLKRRDIFKDYKGTRSHEEDPKFYKFRTGLESCINELGWNLISVDGAEADDVIASIVDKECHRCYCKVPCVDCEETKKFKVDIVIFSGDRDLQQCLAWDRVLIYRAPGLFVSRDTFETEYGVPAKKYGVYKALVGDKSDNIKGVEGFGPSKAKIAINSDSVAEDIWEMGGQKASDEFKLALKLVNLDFKLKLYLDDLYFGPPKIDIIDEKIFCKQFDKKVLFEIKRLKEEF